ncbi:MAG: hybrid sensor histidine kinase/response regulator [Campylobacterota bacterium]|nr:hybrid sensor histidine kinase/response regulator [Campylobacterota bacterium]
MSNIKELIELADGLTVLYVEDEDVAREAVSTILNTIFTNTLVASNGLDGIKLAKSNEIDIVISDINMPKCTGLEMVAKIREIYPSIPTIMITALESSEVFVKSIDLKVDKYLVKPINRDDLFKALEELLHQIKSNNRYKKQEVCISKNLKMIAISKLLDNITHQWRQSLSIISTSVGGIMLNHDAKVSDDNVQQLLASIDTTVTSMDKELQDILLDFEKEHKKEEFNLVQVIDEILANFNSEFNKYNINIISEVDDLNVFINKDSFMQVLNHILENSIDALLLNSNDNKYIKIVAAVDGKKLKLDIIDNGGGILESIKDEIFEPYSTTKHQYIGTGLGLYIVYMLTTKSLAGVISGDNILHKDDNCARFSIVLPL